jgi:hypothetical protein
MTTIAYHRHHRYSNAKVVVPLWRRITLLVVLGYEAAGCLTGGAFLIAAPDGRFMDMPVDLMHGVFPDFLIPGILLFGLGILNAIAFIAVLPRSRSDWFIAYLALGGLLIWFWVEIAILQQIHWLHAMWGLPVIAGGVAGIYVIPTRYASFTKAALICGILSSIFYLSLNIFIPKLWDGYDSASQTVSELSAIGAPTRMLWLWLSTLYTALVVAFSWGVWKSASGNRSLRIAGGLLIAYGLLGVLWPFAPMHLRETLAAGGRTFSDTMHITLAVLTEICFLLALGFAAMALDKHFRIYSIATFFVLLLFGVLTFLASPGIAANQPTPLIGVWERINIGVFLLWVVVLAAVLLHKKEIPKV